MKQQYEEYYKVGDRHICPATGKIGYPTEIGAMMAKATLRRKHPNLRGVYKCPHCPEWHLTSQEQRK